MLELCELFYCLKLAFKKNGSVNSVINTLGVAWQT